MTYVGSVLLHFLHSFCNCDNNFKTLSRLLSDKSNCWDINKQKLQHVKVYRVPLRLKCRNVFLTLQTSKNDNNWKSVLRLTQHMFFFQISHSQFLHVTGNAAIVLTVTVWTYEIAQKHCQLSYFPPRALVHPSPWPSLSSSLMLISSIPQVSATIIELIRHDNKNRMPPLNQLPYIASYISSL